MPDKIKMLNWMCDVQTYLDEAKASIDDGKMASADIAIDIAIQMLNSIRGVMGHVKG